MVLFSEGNTLMFINKIREIPAVINLLSYFYDIAPP